MTALMLMGAGLNAMLGIALLLLWRQDPRFPQVRQWGYSWILLSLGLTLGIALAPEQEPSWQHDLQALAASASIMGSLMLLIAGARSYRQLPFRQALWLPAFLLMMASIVVLARLDHSLAVIAATVYLVAGSWACAWWMGQGGHAGERFVAACFVAVGLVHASSPLLDPLGRSPITHTLGLFVQTTLSLGLILLSVARAHADTRRQSNRFEQLTQHSLQGLVVLQQHRAAYANPAAREMFGFPPGDQTVSQDQSFDLLSTLVPMDQQRSASERHALVLADPDARIEWEATRLTREGRALYVRGLSSHLEWDGAPAELLVMIDDSSRQRAVDALRRQALHDELTDLPNRNFAVARLRELTLTGGAPFALISADVDRFQLVNESLGHAVGDALLHAVARRLCRHLPVQAMLTRLGEDQFLVLLEGMAERSEVEPVVAQILQLLEQPFEVDGEALFVHLSLGVARFPQDGEDVDSLLRAADSAMHRAKQRAGSACEFFEPRMNVRSRARLEAEQSLGRAIVEREFILEYQPKFRADSRKLCGFEALVRWERPGLGRVSPADFVPAAERTGQINSLGQLIVEIASQQLRDWLDRWGLLVPVAVNVSPLQFDDPSFAQRLLDRLDALQLPHQSLEIEITESAAIGHLGRVLPQLQQLRQAGVLCSMDDFGTGQSSLTMLRQLPISCMKLDRSMIEPLPEPQASAIVKATCALGRSLSLEVVAEGVENEAQALAARDLGCTQLQGYHLSRPLAAGAAGELLGRSLG
ncbi:EAL domain-containing protein [Paucibacter sp. DJ1R-11]|uniref:putative bifunctional diguanylate cyclase/phosphodiesterase n=1 Tax=Paucibacter sp. DJ1R-11 TaxID=2893556 RepID=UPI0021E45E10|nr:EAL domain-containing protein [Paucibacter sp. DJ1R-11]MCV2362547.1 EAL domain-containing protein [Paucibacter sp. DJ1R-11]